MDSCVLHRSEPMALGELSALSFVPVKSRQIGTSLWLHWHVGPFSSQAFPSLTSIYCLIYERKRTTGVFKLMHGNRVKQRAKVYSLYASVQKQLLSYSKVNTKPVATKGGR
jgi:hypothetical protein